MISRGFVEEYCFKLGRNEWVLYLALATFYNGKQRRAFPTPEQLYAVVPISRYGRSRAMRKLIELELIEVWGETLKRRRRTFYRLLNVSDGRRHLANRQQRSYKELRELAGKGELPADEGWLHRADPKGVHEESPCDHQQQAQA